MKVGNALIALAASVLVHGVRPKREQLELVDAELQLETQDRGRKREHAATSTSNWFISEEDKAQVDAINLLGKGLIDDGLDWKWDIENTSEREWYFGLVKMTDQEPKQALISHLVNRHGLGLLMLAKKEKAPGDQFPGVAFPNTSGGILDFYEAMTKHEEILKIRKTLSKLTLGGLRHLHSHDHEWSVYTGEKNNIPNCGRFAPGGCVLQAGFSSRVNKFMLKHGFSDQAALTAVLRDQEQLQKTVYNRNSLQQNFNCLPPFPVALRKNFFLPEHTDDGDIDVNLANTFRLAKLTSEGGDYTLSGRFYWEAGGVSEVDKIPISKEQYDDMHGDLKTYTIKMAQATDDYIKQHITVTTHKEKFAPNAKYYWAGELVEFFHMWAKTDAEYTGDDFTEWFQCRFADGFAD
jgi:hypothetical protein